VEDLKKKHTLEIEALRMEHESALKAAVEAAVSTSKSNASNGDGTKAAVEAAIAAHDKELQAKHAEEISAAVERGRMEQGAKIKLKDAQLIRSQAKLKEVEAQVMEWRKAGLVPNAAATSTAAVASSSTAPPATPTTPVASTSKTLLPTAAPAPATASTTSAPSAPHAAPAAGPGPARRTLGGAVPLGTDAAGRGRGRGVPPPPRGTRGLSIRGAAPGARGGSTIPTARGAATAATNAAAGPTSTQTPASASTAVGVQIMGAASKRGRDDDMAGDDSLAKRLKPANEVPGVVGGAAQTANSNNAAVGGGAGGSKPPVAIRRPPPS